MSTICCPPNAEKYLAPDYTHHGRILTTNEGIEFYGIGEEHISGTKKSIYILPDVFGWNAGRTRNIADYLSEHGYFVVIPKILIPPVNGGTDGDGKEKTNTSNLDMSFTFIKNPEFIKENWDWEKIQPRVNSVTNHLKSQGIEKIYLLGFCWGGWVGTYMIASEGYENYVCQAIGHPSVSLEDRFFSRSTQALFDKVQRPIFFMPTKGDPDEYRENGAWYLSLKARFPTTETYDFPNNDHGFIPRSDLSLEVNKIAVDEALEKTLAYFAKH